MDIAQAKTFLEIAETGSFIAAASRLNVTQTAVSARIRALEEQLGHRLFVRNKTGARLTPAGERFRAHALTLVQVWDRARAQAGLPARHGALVGVGVEDTLWDPLLAGWLAWMRRTAPDLALRATVDSPARLLEAVHNGGLELAVLYEPPPQPAGIVVELLRADRLVLVTTGTADAPADHVDVDWGPAFRESERAAFPQRSPAGLAVSHGPLALACLLEAGGTAYLRLSAIRRHLEDGRLRRVPGAPEFSHCAHMVYATRIEGDLVDLIRRGFRLSARHRRRPAPAES